MTNVYVVQDPGCDGVGCCSAVLGVYTSYDAICRAYPDYYIVDNRLQKLTSFGYRRLNIETFRSDDNG